MASTHKHIRSSTANKRPTTSIADGQIALNTNSSSPGLYFKDSTGASIIKVGPVHIGATAPNASPPSGGSSGNSTGEIWLDTSLTPNGVKIWDGSAWVNATPIGSTTVQGLLELATNAETQTGSDTARAVTPAGLQSKISDSTSTTSSTTIASSTAVKAAYDLANAALPLSGGTLTGNLTLDAQNDLRFGDADSSNWVAFQAPSTVTSNVTWTLPSTDGSASQALITNGSGTLSWTSVGAGDVTLNGTQTLTNKTLTDPAIIGTILEDVYTITDGAAFEVDPGNGSVQLITLGASRTPKATNFAAGESVTLMVNDGSAYTLTWTDSTWGGSGVVWTGGSPPTLATSGYTVIQFWKISSQVYGALVGGVA